MPVGELVAVVAGPFTRRWTAAGGRIPLSLSVVTRGARTTLARMGQNRQALDAQVLHGRANLAACGRLTLMQTRALHRGQPRRGAGYT